MSSCSSASGYPDHSKCGKIGQGQRTYSTYEIAIYYKFNYYQGKGGGARSCTKYFSPTGTGLQYMGNPFWPRYHAKTTGEGVHAVFATNFASPYLALAPVLSSLPSSSLSSLILHLENTRCTSNDVRLEGSE